MPQITPLTKLGRASKPLIDYMECCGFRAEIVKEQAKELVPVEVWLFTRRDIIVQC